jgi:hypothetical protein
MSRYYPLGTTLLVGAGPANLLFIHLFAGDHCLGVVW